MIKSEGTNNEEARTVDMMLGRIDKGGGSASFPRNKETWFRRLVGSLAGPVFWWVVLLPFVLAGCGGSGTPEGGDGRDKKVVGASLLTQTHVFYQDMVRAMREAAAENDITLRVQYAEFDLRNQNDQVELFTTQGVDAIIIAPADSTGIAPVIADAREAGIPVFTVDIAAHGADVVSHVASDNYGGGKLAAQYLVEQLDGKGRVAIIDHPAVESVQQRTAGFLDVIEKHPGIEIVQRVPGEGQRDKALKAAQDILESCPGLGAVFAINDDSALGALAAVEAAGLEDEVIIVGFDGTPEACEAIAKGSALKADVAQFPKNIGRKAIEVIAEHFRGEDVPAEVPVKVEVFDKARLNAEQ